MCACRVYEGAPHNIADSMAGQAARHVLRLVQSAGDQDLLIVLISGGGSALLPCPVEGVSLDEKRKVKFYGSGSVYDPHPVI